MSSGDSFKHILSNGDKKNQLKKILLDAENGMKLTKTDNIPVLRLHKHPFLTIYYFVMETIYLLFQFIGYIFSHKKLISIIFICGFSLFSVNLVEGAHQKIIMEALKKIQWWGWWVFLGFLSSCGFGSGLHTFVLYLGPFIAKVTMAAYECGTTDFPEPPYPEQFVCPDVADGMIPGNMRSLIVVKKILLESMLWGLGTAIGELPPYFMARAAALSGSIDQQQPQDESAWHKRAQEAMKTIVKRVGFVGIVLCASVPNPLFDLAGMTCGHFLVPFSTFFGATVLGKAVNKMLLQMAFVVFIFSQDKVAWLQSCIRNLPRYGESLNSLIDEFLTQQREKIHKSIIIEKQGWLQCIFGYIQLLVILGFVISIIHSLADNYAVRLRQWKISYNECTDDSKLKNH